MIKDYENAIACFGDALKYRVMYQMSDKVEDENYKDGDYKDGNYNEHICYNNKIYDSAEGFKKNVPSGKIHPKLRWDVDEIELFVERARKYFITYKHDSLIFLLSSHGEIEEGDDVIIDSELEQYSQEEMFSMFTPDGDVLLESYEETEEQSNYLLGKPKVFFLDCCRGQFRPKVIEYKEDAPNNKEYSSDVDSKDDIKTEAIVEKDPKSGDIEVEVVTTKGNNDDVQQIDAAKHKYLFAQASHFCKVRASTPGASSAEGVENGGMLLRNVYEIFRNEKYRRKGLTNMNIRIRERVKKKSTLHGAIKFTQVVEDTSTLTNDVIFVSVNDKGDNSKNKKKKEY